jgi:hypothetical protein
VSGNWKFAEDQESHDVTERSLDNGYHLTGESGIAFLAFPIPLSYQSLQCQPGDKFGINLKTPFLSMLSLNLIRRKILTAVTSSSATS